MTAGVTYGLPSRSPPIQEPKVSGRRGGWQLDAEPAQAWRRGRRAPARPRRRAGRAGSRRRCGPRRSARAGSSRSSSVCHSRSSNSARRRSARCARLGGRTGGRGRLGVELVGDGPQLGEDGAAGGLGGVGGEDRPDREPTDGGVDLRDRHAALGDQRAACVQPAALVGAAAAQLPRPVHLLGDVGQVEVGGEGPGELGAGGHIEAGQAVGGGLAGPCGPAPRTSSTRSSSGWPSCRARVCAEQRAEPADVGAQRGVGVGWCADAAADMVDPSGRVGWDGAVLVSPASYRAVPRTVHPVSHLDLSTSRRLRRSAVGFSHTLAQIACDSTHRR